MFAGLLAGCGLFGEREDYESRPRLGQCVGESWTCVGEIRSQCEDGHWKAVEDCSTAGRTCFEMASGEVACGTR